VASLLKDDILKNVFVPVRVKLLQLIDALSEKEMKQASDPSTPCS
jgi:hypothetical protein